jgi:hypothetical protein
VLPCTVRGNRRRATESQIIQAVTGNSGERRRCDQRTV